MNDKIKARKDREALALRSNLKKKKIISKKKTKKNILCQFSQISGLEKCQ